MKIRPGVRLASAVSEAEVVVVRAPASEVDLACGGVPMVEVGSDKPDGAVLDHSLGDGPEIGKRYANEEAGVELLCTRGGEGALTVDTRVLPLKGAKPLPSSD